MKMQEIKQYMVFQTFAYQDKFQENWTTGKDCLWSKNFIISQLVCFLVTPCIILFSYVNLIYMFILAM